jgi:DNA-directed RNA polymerase subunit alpha
MLHNSGVFGNGYHRVPQADFLLNLNQIVLRSNLCGVKGPRYITAQDTILPSSIEIIDTIQPIANLREPINFCIELQMKRDRRYQMEPRSTSFQEDNLELEAGFTAPITVRFFLIK